MNFEIRRDLAAGTRRRYCAGDPKHAGISPGHRAWSYKYLALPGFGWVTPTCCGGPRIRVSIGKSAMPQKERAERAGNGQDEPPPTQLLSSSCLSAAKEAPQLDLGLFGAVVRIASDGARVCLRFFSMHRHMGAVHGRTPSPTVPSGTEQTLVRLLYRE